jgi:hypothetical protein
MNYAKKQGETCEILIAYHSSLASKNLKEFSSSCPQYGFTVQNELIVTVSTFQWNFRAMTIAFVVDSQLH